MAKSHSISVLQVCDSVIAPHGMPPFTAAVRTVLVLLCVPPSHWDEHVDHVDQVSLTSSQSIGQLCSLQSSVSESGRQTPPCSSSSTSAAAQ